MSIIQQRKVGENQGFALVLVLAFIALLVGIALAFLSNSLLQRQVSNSSANIAKADLLAQGALDATIGDLQSEIAANSASVTAFANHSKLYTVSNAAKMVPESVGFQRTGGLENLVSYSGTKLYAAMAADRATGSQTTQISSSGRNMTVDRWNKPLFLPDTQKSIFTNIKWIPVTRTSGNTVGADTIGRYAYVIYDEGGLLDANVAGHPDPTRLSTDDVNQISRHGGEAFADLTQIPGLTQPLIDQLVGWRNSTSVANGKYVPSQAFNINGFLHTSSIPPLAGQSDQAFSSRQQLIEFFNKLGIPSTVLEYFTTFSRKISQPSFVPDATKVSSAPTAVASSGGNNSGGGDSIVNPSFLAARVATGGWNRNDGTIAVAGEPLVKKRFDLNKLAWVTCAGPIADDNGVLSSNATVKSAINILETKYGFSEAFLRQGGPTNIYKYFGLVWEADSRSGIGNGAGKWVYRHSSSSYPGSIGLSGGGTPIRTLSTGTNTVVSQNREADFFELLKASLTLGSLGKSYHYFTAPDNTTPLGYQESLDNWVDLQVIQIGANIINQAAIDGYSRCILFSDGATLGGRWHEIHGVVDLPYIYRIREGKIPIVNSNPADDALPAINTAPSPQGTGVVLQEPEIWNPQAINSNAEVTLRPTSFRLIAVSTDPENIATTLGRVQPNGTWRYHRGGGSDDPTPASSSTIIDTTSSPLTFNIPSGRLDLFREPTLLLKPGIPTGSNLAGPVYTSILQATQYVSNGVADNRAYTGISLGNVHLAWATTIPAAGIAGFVGDLVNTPKPATPTAGAVPIGSVTYNLPGNTAKGITYKLQYRDPAGVWQTYDDKFSLIANAGSYDEPCTNGQPNTPKDYNKTFYKMVVPGGATTSDHIIGSEVAMVCFDPRTSRFGMQPCGSNGRGSEVYSMPLGRGFGMYATATNYGKQFLNGWGAPVGSNIASIRNAASQNIVQTMRPDEYKGFPLTGGFNDSPGSGCGFNTGPVSPDGWSFVGGGNWYNSTQTGWCPRNQLAITNPAYGTPAVMLAGDFCQNNPDIGNATSAWRINNDWSNLPTSGTYTNPVSWAGPRTAPYDYNQQYVADPDGVIRRGMSGYVPIASGNGPSAQPPTSGPSGLPLKVAYQVNGSGVMTPLPSGEYASRPIVLNRPFQSVGELGYVFSGMPWRSIDMNTPESGSVALLDVFTVNDTDNDNALVAGSVNLNTRQLPVLQAILSGTSQDELNPTTSTLAPLFSNTTSTAIANALLARTAPTNTTTGQGPMVNISQLVGGTWSRRSTVGPWSSINGAKSFVGFTADAVNSPSNDLSSVITASAYPNQQRVERFREAAIRSLASCGQVRVWNLMIDLVSQTGRYSSAGDFRLEGESRYWVHIAIDRLTGEVLDKQIEVVKE